MQRGFSNQSHRVCNSQRQAAAQRQSQQQLALRNGGAAGVVVYCPLGP